MRAKLQTFPWQSGYHLQEVDDLPKTDNTFTTFMEGTTKYTGTLLRRSHFDADD